MDAESKTVSLAEAYSPDESGSLLNLILLSIVTLGIYYYYWLNKFSKNINVVCDGDGESTGGLLKIFFFSLITLGIYYLVWLYMVGDRMRANAPKYGLSFHEGGLALVLWLFIPAVGPFISLHIMIKNSNALIRAYNKVNFNSIGG